MHTVSNRLPPGTGGGGGYSGFQVKGMNEGFFWVLNFRFQDFFFLGGGGGRKIWLSFNPFRKILRLTYLAWDFFEG